MTVTNSQYSGTSAKNAFFNHGTNRTLDRFIAWCVANIIERLNLPVYMTTDNWNAYR